MKNKTTIIIYVILAVVIVGGLGYLAQRTPTGGAGGKVSGQTAGASSLSADEKAFDFGEISMAAGVVKRTFKIKNNGAGTALISKLYTSCMCTNATLKTARGSRGPFGMPGHGFVPRLDENIAPREEAEVEVVFDPAAHGPAGVGKIERAVYLEQEGTAPLELRISAMVKP